MTRMCCCPAEMIVCLCLVAGAVLAETNDPPSGLLNRASDYFEEHHTVVSWDTGLGYADNVTLVPNNEVSDLFLLLRATAEYRRQFSGGASLYADLSLERTQYFQENDASEWFIDASGEYVRDFENWAWGVADTLSYEDYRSFDEEGGVLPSGKYEALVNKARLYGSWFPAAGHELEAGASWRVKDYLDSDLDFDETGIDCAYRWHFTERWSTDLGGTYRKQDYADWQALSADGTLAETNPIESFTITTLRGGVTRALAHEGRAYLALRYADYDENFEDEASYDESGIDVGAVLSIGRNYVAEIRLGLSGRDYGVRTVEGGGARKDDVRTLRLEIERRLRGVTSAYLALNLGQRDSNDPNEDYNDNAITIGLRGVL